MVYIQNFSGQLKGKKGKRRKEKIMAVRWFPDYFEASKKNGGGFRQIRRDAVSKRVKKYLLRKQVDPDFREGYRLYRNAKGVTLIRLPNGRTSAVSE